MLALAAVAVAAVARGRRAQPAFEGHSAPIEGKVRERIEGSSWHPGCPVGLGKLRLLELTYRGFDGESHRGRLIVNRRYDDEIIAVFKRLYAIGYPIRQHGADRPLRRRRPPLDGGRQHLGASTAASSPARSRWSMHAYGLAIDLNPVENPYVSGSHVSPPAGREPTPTAPATPAGMIHDGDRVVKAFARRAGWEWLGDGPRPGPRLPALLRRRDLTVPRFELADDVHLRSVEPADADDALRPDRRRPRPPGPLHAVGRGPDPMRARARSSPSRLEQEA